MVMSGISGAPGSPAAIIVSFSCKDAEPEIEVTLIMMPFSLPTVALNSLTCSSMVACICPPKLCQRVRVTGFFGSRPLLGPQANTRTRAKNSITIPTKRFFFIRASFLPTGLEGKIKNHPLNHPFLSLTITPRMITAGVISVIMETATRQIYAVLCVYVITPIYLDQVVRKEQGGGCKMRKEEERKRGSRK